MIITGDLIQPSVGSNISVPDGSGIAVAGTGIASFSSAGITANAPYWNIVDQKANGVGGGNTVATTWTKRTLNTTIGSNTITGSSLTSDVFTLPAGTYRFFASSTFFGGNSQLRLRNTSDATTTLVGIGVISTSSQTASNSCNLFGRFTITATKNFELQYYASNVLTNGLGSPISSSESEIYTIIEIWKLG